MEIWAVPDGSFVIAGDPRWTEATVEQLDEIAGGAVEVSEYVLDPWPSAVAVYARSSEVVEMLVRSAEASAGRWPSSGPLTVVDVVASPGGARVAFGEVAKALDLRREVTVRLDEVGVIEDEDREWIAATDFDAVVEILEDLGFVGAAAPRADAASDEDRWIGVPPLGAAAL